MDPDFSGFDLEWLEEIDQDVELNDEDRDFPLADQLGTWIL